jgi:uncharacterized protein (TIGR00661 family)
MLCILGEGRGHMTQAIAVKEMVERAGHQIVSVVMGVGSHRQVPPFFTTAMKMPVERIPTLDFTYRNNRQVNLPATLAGILRRIPAYWRALRKLKTVVEETQPDVILNFFEPLTGIYALLFRQRPPVVAIAHQFMYGHPDYVRAPGLRLQQLAMKWYVQLVGASSTRLALSLYEARDLPDIKVSPPILRRQLFEQHPNPNGNFVLAYLLNHGYAEQIIEWHQRNPATVLHCFYDKPDAPAEFCYDETLTFHRLDGEKFLCMMADCKYVACTAGFESVSEAAYLGKPLFLVPVENHVEQQINAIDATRVGLGITDNSFNLDRLSELPPTIANSRFRAWLGRADSILLQTLDRAVARAGDAAHHHGHLEPRESEAT